MANLQRFRNNATAVLSGALSQGGTTAVLSAGMGNRFDAPANGDYFLLTLYEKDDAGNEVNMEVVKVTARVGDTLTIVRDVENLTGQVGGYSYPSSVTRTVFMALRWTAAGAAGMLQAGQNLADLGSVSSARGNLGLGGAATANVGTSAGTVAAGNHTHTSSVLTDMTTTGQSLLTAANPAAAQTSLGLGGAALLNVGTAAGTVAAGNHTHTTAALTDMTALGISLATASSAAAARTAIGAGTSSLALGTMSGQAATSSGSAGTSANAAREDHTHPIGGSYMPTTGGTFTGAISVPAGATGSQVPRAQDVAKLSSRPVTFVAANTTAAAGNYYIIVQPSTTITLPTSPSAGDIIEISTYVSGCVVDFGTLHLRGRTPGAMTLNVVSIHMFCQWTGDVNYGWSMYALKQT